MTNIILKDEETIKVNVQEGNTINTSVSGGESINVNATVLEENKVEVNAQENTAIDVSVSTGPTVKADVPPINYIPGYKVAEEERRAYYEDFKQQVENGVFNGKNGEPGPPGAKGDSGVYVGTEEPMDSEKIVWVDPDGNFEEYALKEELPTKTSDLENDSGFINDLTNYYKKSEVYSKEEVEQLSESIDDRMSNLEQVGGQIIEQLEDKADKSEIPSLEGYAKEKWVKDQEYMPVPDFHEYMEFMYYDKTQTDEKFNDYYNKEAIDEIVDSIPDSYYNKEEIDTKLEDLPSEGDSGIYVGPEEPTEPEKVIWVDTDGDSVEYAYKDDVYTKEEIDTKLEELPTGGTELISGDNAIIEDNQINVFTNTGYSISDKDVKYQDINSTGYKPKKIIFVDERSLTFIIDGSNKLMVSKNNIDFEIQEFARNIDDIIFIPYNEALVILSSIDGVIMTSSDYGSTWNEYSNIEWVDCDYLFTYKENSAGFNLVRKSERELRCYKFIDGDYKPYDNGYCRTDYLNFMARFNNNYFISCDSTGKFGYCNERNYYDNFADIPEGYTVSAVVSHESTPIVGLKNSNKIFQLRYTGNTGTSKWTEYTLPEVCTVNDVIYYSRTKEFYILTDVCSYFKTKDFVTYTKVDTGVRGLQGCVTLMGIQALTNNDGKLLLAPARTRLEDKAQEWDTATQKERWVGEGLKINSTTGVVSVRVMNPLIINPSTGAIRLQQLTMDYLPDELKKTKMLAEAPVHSAIISEYGDLETWFWEVGYPEEYACIHKIIFDEATSFWDFANYETEYFVEKYEYGYIYYDESDNYFCEYVKLGNFANLLDRE